mgnify:CR=1 FL=1
MKKTTPLLMLAAMAFTPAAFSAPAGTLSVHILDQQTGMPPSDVTVTLEKQQQNTWTRLPAAKPTTTDVSNHSIRRIRTCSQACIK